MQPFRLHPLALVLLLGLAFGAGCNRSTPPPAPLSVQELPAVFDQAFSKANAQTKALAGQVVASVQAQDYPQAFTAIQSLGNTPGLTQQQLNVTSRAILTVNSLLQAAQAKGDASAAQALENYRLNK